MKKNKIKDTGLEVTELSFGTSSLGSMPDTYGYEVPEQRAQETLKRFFQGPVNMLDTSRNYAMGESEKRIGIAISDGNQKIATPYKTLEKIKSSKLIEDIKSIIKENDVKGIIVGNPINMDGSYGKSSQSAKDIAINLADKINIPVCLWDERLSTVGAFNLSSELDINVSKREKDIDKFAAAFILQGALDYLQN